MAIGAAASLRRITQEHENLQREPTESGTAGPVGDDDLLFWDGVVIGPENTPYAQKTFSITIDFPKNYPLNPLTVVLTTPMFHPNVSEDGEVRLAELEKNKWMPAYTVRVVMISLQAMLSDPNLEEGCVLNEEAASLYLQDREAFEAKARQWTVPDAGH